ncbi:MAG: TonB-dependent siderophore receptor, partial [Beijerinckiaceae bacterium]|nr:TonB-dependent siderophore receptor [Beijerinckiaceae bacterium]
APKEGYSAPAISQSTTKIDVPTFELPVVVNTVPEQVLQDQAIIDIGKPLENVSSVRASATNLDCYGFFIRGFFSTEVFRDGLKTSIATPQCPDTANLQDIQVLKGPASFLFGRADPGGIINLVTKRPINAPYYSVTQQFGSFNLYRTVWDLTGPVQVPVVDNGAVSYRFSGSYTNGGQFTDFGKNSKIFLAPAISWQMDGTTTFNVDGQLTLQDAQGFTGIPALTAIPPSATNPGYPASLPVYRSFGEPNQPLDTLRNGLIHYEFKHHFDANWAITNRFLAARATAEKNNLQGTCFLEDPIFGGPCVDQNFNPLPAFFLTRQVVYQKLTGTNYSANLDLTGKFYVLGAKNDVLIGADYFYQYFNYVLGANGNFPINIFNPIYGTVPTFAFQSAPFLTWSGLGSLTDPFNFTLFRAFAEKDLGIYAQDLITLFDSLHILLGARYDLADVRSGASSSFFGAPTIASFGAAYDSFGRNPIQHSGFLSPRIGVNYEPVPWIAFYGSYSKSFGVANGISTNNLPLPPEISEGWEGGVKTKLLDGGLLATLAFFDITKSNVLTPADPNDPFSELRPIGAVRSTGAELDILGKLTNELSVIASYSHIDARVIKDNGGLLGLAPGQFAPNSGSLFLTYDFPTDSQLYGWRVGGGVYAVSNRWGDDQNTFILPSYARLDAFAKYQFVAAGLRWSAQINVNNITDARYYSGADIFYNQIIPRLAVFPGAPRNVLATLRVEF